MRILKRSCPLQAGEEAAEALHSDGVPGRRERKGCIPAEAELRAQGGQVVAPAGAAPAAAAASCRGGPSLYKITPGSLLLLSWAFLCERTDMHCLVKSSSSLLVLFLT